MEKDKLAHFTVLFMQPVTKKDSGNEFRGQEIFLLHHFHTHVCEGIICLLLLVFKWAKIHFPNSRTQENEKYFTVFKTYLFKRGKIWLPGKCQTYSTVCRIEFFFYTRQKKTQYYTIFCSETILFFCKISVISVLPITPSCAQAKGVELPARLSVPELGALGTLSKDDDDGCENATNLHIQ